MGGRGNYTTSGDASQLERRRFFSEATMAKIPQPEELLELTDGVPSDQASTTIS